MSVEDVVAMVPDVPPGGGGGANGGLPDGGVPDGGVPGVVVVVVELVDELTVGEAVVIAVPCAAGESTSTMLPVGEEVLGCAVSSSSGVVDSIGSGGGRCFSGASMRPCIGTRT